MSSAHGEVYQFLLSIFCFHKEVPYCYLTYVGWNGNERNACVPYSICTALKDTIRNRIIHHSNQYICALMSLVRPDLRPRWHAGLDG